MKREGLEHLWSLGGASAGAGLGHLAALKRSASALSALPQGEVRAESRPPLGLLLVPEPSQILRGGFQTLIFPQ